MSQPPTASFDYTVTMNIQDTICKRYEPQLAAIAALDRQYYSNKGPTAADRAEYYARQEELESIRTRMYQEFDASKKPPSSTRQQSRATVWPA